MAVALTLARYREVDGRDSMARASIWQGNAGALFDNNVVYVDPALAVATTATQIKTTATAGFTVGGGLYSKAATDNFWTFGVAGTSATTVAVSSFQKYAVCVDDAGVATVQEATQSTISAAAVTWGNVTAQAGANPKNPWAALVSILYANRCIFGIVTVATDATHAFIPGTTAFNATGITTTFRGSIDPALNPVIANERGLIAGRDF